MDPVENILGKYRSTGMTFDIVAKVNYKGYYIQVTKGDPYGYNFDISNPNAADPNATYDMGMGKTKAEAVRNAKALIDRGF